MQIKLAIFENDTPNKAYCLFKILVGNEKLKLIVESNPSQTTPKLYNNVFIEMKKLKILALHEVNQI